MADILINGVTYASVPRIDVPKPNNGGNVSFYETSGDTATAADIASGKTAHGANGLIIGEASGGGTPVLQNKTVKSTTQSQTITADSGYDGLGTITVSPINLQVLFAYPSQSDQIITPGSGMDGIGRITVKRAVLQDKTISPSTSQQVITADTGKYGLGQVTVNAMNLQTKQVTPTSSQQTITADSGYDGLSEVVVAASSGGGGSPVLQNVTVKSREEEDYVSASEGYDGIGIVTVSPMVLQQKTVTPSASQQTITADSGYDALSQVVVNAASGVNPNDLLGGTQNSLTNVDVTTFWGLQKLRNIDISCDEIKQYAFSNVKCQTLTIRRLQTVGLYGLSKSLDYYDQMTDLNTIILPDVTSLGDYSISSNAYLGAVYLPNCTSIGTQALANCYRLHDVYIGKMCTLANTNAFKNTGIAMSGSWAKADARIHVPASLEQSFKENGTWSVFADKIVGDYVVS